MTDDDVRKAAAALNEAERQALQQMLPGRWHTRDEQPPYRVHGRMVRPLRQKGLVQTERPVNSLAPLHRLTPLGEAARAMIVAPLTLPRGTS